MDNKFSNGLTTFLFYSGILVYIIAFNTAHNPPGGWYQQFLPELNGSSIVDITFTDSLTGYAVTSANSDTISYIIKTSNGGDNWNILLNDTGRSFANVQFINNLTGYASTLYGRSTSKLFKTIDGGKNWLRLYPPGMFNEFRNISVVSENEIWITDINVFSGGVFRSTDSGETWELKYPPGFSGGPDRIYMINSRIGFISNGNNTQAYLKKTTNAGDNWFEITNGSGWVEMNFKDELTGWRVLFSTNNVQKTTDGGINWETILHSSLGNPNIGITNFDVLNESILWGIYYDSYFTFPNGTIRWVILRTTNNGMNWGYQLPDTSIRSSYDLLDFTDSLHGWAYDSRINGVHTVTGGDTVTYPITSISNSSTIIPDEIKLYQNYPNPFNPVTKINYELRITNYEFVSLKVYDVLGKEVATLINEKKNTGSYEVEFDARLSAWQGSILPSGVYFYSLIADGRLVDTKRMILLK